jgi:serine/threonine protein kinase
LANPALRPRFLAPGDKLGKFDLIRQIAVGGMAELYLARTMGIEGFEKLVVVKRILPQYVENPSFVNMFLNEARLSATLHHPNITQVYDIGVEEGDYFFSMEYVHGEDLGRLNVTAQENGVPISLDCALTLVAGLCAGLHYAHEKAGPDGTPLNVVHRDVSPSNVLVSYDGAVKLVDFGIARAGSQPAKTMGGLKGKISYMSPEQCKGKVTLDRRSDVFSIGSILYELTTGQLPFTDETEYGVLNQIVTNDAPPPSSIVPSYPPQLEAILMKALARDPDKRYATALELQGQIEDYAHESRLRVSPLVLARLMSTLFPARLEEWDHARAQGAFFVEQHVVRTLIESGKTSDSSVDLPQAKIASQPVQAPPDDEKTDVITLRPLDTQVGPAPVPAVPVQSPPAQPMKQPRMGSSGFEPSEPLTDTLAGPPLAVRPSPMPLPAPRPTPLPSQLEAAAAEARRSQPQVVPVVVLPHPGTLVSNRGPSDGAAPMPVNAETSDVTERVRVPTPLPMRDDATMLRPPRSRMTLFVGIGIAAAAIGIAIIAFGGGGGSKDKSPSSESAKATAPEPKPEIKDEPEPEPVAKEPEPVAKEPEPVANEPEPPKTEPKIDKKRPPVVKTPAIAKTPVKRTPPPVVKKPETKKDPAWNAESPFMPVRPDKK